MLNYIIINGVNSTEIDGLLIQSLPPITKPLMRTQVEEIDGRDGDIITKLGYSAYDKELTIGLHGDYDVDAVIAYFATEGTITFSNEPDKVYNFKQLEQIDFERLIRFKQATVTLHCQPYKYELDESVITDIGSIVEEAKIVSFDSQSADEISVGYRFTPVQNLNGYDHPWVGGTGKNLLNQDAYTKPSSIKGVPTTWNSDGTFTMNGTSTNTSATVNVITSQFPLKAGTYTFSGAGVSGSDPFFLRIRYYPEGGSATTARSGNGSFTIYNDTTVDIVVYCPAQTSVNATYHPMIRLSSVTDATYEPWSNICPITGHTDGTVTRTAKNMFPIGSLDATSCFYQYGTAWVAGVGNGSISVSGDSFTLTRYTKDYAYWVCLGECKSNVPVTVSFDAVGNVRDIDCRTLPPTSHPDDTTRFYRSDDLRGIASVTRTFTPTQDGYVYIEIYTSTADLVTTVSNLQYEFGEAKTEYTRGASDSYTTSFGGTYYGGTWDIGGGAMYRSYSLATFDGSENWGTEIVASGMINFYVSLSSAGKMTDRKTGQLGTELMMNQLIGKVTGEMGTAYVSSGGFLNVKAPFSTATEWKTYLNTHNLQIAYPLAVENYTQITPQTVTSLIGINNVFANSDKVVVTHPSLISITNKGNTIARPTMTIYGSGNLSVFLNGLQIFQIALGDTGSITIDSEAMEAYQDGILRNRLVTGDYENFVFQVGENVLSVTGAHNHIDRIEITKYSRWI